MRETEARRADLERQHAEAQHSLREKMAGRYQGPESVEALQSKIRELEKKTELQMVRHEELSLELTSLKRARSRGPSALGHHSGSSGLAGMSIATATWPPAGSEIDRLMAKLEQDRYRLTYDNVPTYDNLFFFYFYTRSLLARSSEETSYPRSRFVTHSRGGLRKEVAFFFTSSHRVRITSDGQKFRRVYRFFAHPDSRSSSDTWPSRRVRGYRTGVSWGTDKLVSRLPSGKKRRTVAQSGQTIDTDE